MTKKKKPTTNKFEALIQKSISRLEKDAQTIALDAYVDNLGKYSGKSLAKFLAQIEKDGAQDALMGVKMERIASAIAGPAPKKKGRGRPKKAVATSGKRLSKAQLNDLQGKVLGYVKANPNCRKKEIAAHLGLPSKKLFSVFKGLVADGKLKTKGKKAGMTYSIAGKKKS
jgi:hypothetical protein